MTRRMPSPIYDPSTDGSLSLWLDGSDTTTIDKAGPLPITNGATVTAWRTKAGTSRTFQLIGPNTRPTWESNVQNGLGGVRCNNQILSSNVLTGMQSLTGRTVSVVFKQVTSTPGAAQGYTTTVPHQTGSADGVQVLLYGSAGAPAAGGRRIQADTFAGFNAIDPTGTGARILGSNETFIISAIYDFTNGTIQIIDNGHTAGLNALTSSGSTAALNPYAMSIGGVLQENGSLGSNSGNGFMNGYVFEVLDWFSKRTLDQVFLANDYLRRRWKVA